jgi:hypothetical protein
MEHGESRALLIAGFLLRLLFDPEDESGVFFFFPENWLTFTGVHRFA